MPEQNGVFKALLLSLCGFVYKLGATFAVLLSFSSFLKISGRAGLPYFYIGLSAASLLIGAGLFVSRFGRQVTPRISYVLNPVLALLLTWVGLNYASLSYSGIFALYIAVSLYDVYFGIFFWNAANAILTVREMRQWVGLISGLTFAGGILLGYLFPVLFSLASYSSCYLICAALFLVLPIFVAILPPGREEAGAEPLGQQNSSTGDVIDAIARHPLSAMICGAMVLIAFSRYSMSFLFSAALSLRFADERELAAFAGAFESSLRVFTLIAQSFVLPVLLKRFRPPALLRFSPLLLMAGSVLLLALPGFWGLMCFQFLLMASIRTFDLNLFNLFYNLYEKSLRSRFRFLADGMVFPGAVILTGLLLANLEQSSEGNILYWLLLVAGGFSWHLAGRATSGYFLALQLNLHKNQPHAEAAYQGESDAIIDSAAEQEKIEAMPVKHRPQALVRLARKNSRAAAEIIVALMGRARDDGELTMLIRIAGRTDSPETREAVARYLDERSWTPRVVAESVEAAYKIMHGAAVPHLLPLLASTSNRVRANAVLAITRLTNDEKVLKIALQSLLEMSRSGQADFRASAAAVVGELPNFCFKDLLLLLLQDDDEKVRLAALKSCEKWRNPDLIKNLIQTAEKFAQNAEQIGRSIEALRLGILNRLEERAAEIGVLHQVQEIVSRNRSPRFIEIFLKLLIIRPGTAVCALMETVATHSDCSCLEIIDCCCGLAGMNIGELADRLTPERVSTHEATTVTGILGCLNRTEFIELAQLAVKKQSGREECRALFVTGCRLHALRDSESGLLAKLASADSAERDLAIELIESACSNEVAKLLQTLAAGC